MSAHTIIRTGHRNPDRISIAGAIVELFIVCAAAIVFNLYPRAIGFWRSAADPTSFTPLLGPGFAPFLPWLNTYWLWAFCLCVANLALQRLDPGHPVGRPGAESLRRRDLRRHVRSLPLPGNAGRDAGSEVGAVGRVLRLAAGRLGPARPSAQVAAAHQRAGRRGDFPARS